MKDRMQIDIRGRIYGISMTEEQVIALIREFDRKRRRCIRSSLFSGLNQLGEKRFLRLCWKFVDELLGAGACERYCGPEANTAQMLMLLKYVSDEMERQRLKAR